MSSQTAYVTSHPGTPKRLLMSALGLALLPAAAQAGNATADTANQGDDQTPKTTRLESVKVQATTVNSTSPKFTASLLDTPRAVTVIPQSILQETGAISLTDALRTVPGITFGAGEGGNPNGDRPFIRGFDSQSSIFIDGVRSSGSQSREIFDIEQVEVIKGPSSAYTGRGSVGGSINLLTKAPKTENSLNGSLGLGTADYQRATVDWNQLIGSDSAFRLNVLGHRNDIADRGGPDARRWGIAPSITFGLHADTSVTLSYYHLQSNEQPDSGIPYGNPNNYPQGSGKPIHVPHDTYYGLYARDFQKQRNDVGTILVKHSFGKSWLLRNTTVYGRSTNDYIWTQPDDSQGNFIVNGGVWRRNNNRVSNTTNLTNQTDLTGEFQTGSIKHSLATGIEVSNEKTNRDSYRVGNFNAAGRPLPGETGSIVNGACTLGTGASSGYWCAPVINPNPNDPWNGPVVRALNYTRITTDTRSAWAFDTMEFNEQWSLNLGARFDSFQTKSRASTGVIKNDSNFWSYQGGLVYKPTSNGSIYLSYGTSANPPGVDAGDGADGLAVTNNDLKPENSRNIELGSKWDLFDKHLSLTAAVFRTEKTNARVNTGGRGSPQINAGKQRVDGVELGLSGDITERWNVFGGYTYLKSKLLKPAPGDLASKDNQFPNTPENSFTLWTSYAITPQFTIGGGAYAMSKVYGNTQNTKWVPGYTRFDAMASYVVNRNLTLQLNVQNLTNKYYFDKAYAAHYASVAAGRSAILNFNYAF
ncbi:TonB-dependent receptor [Dyella tabacisoli]|uniref:TonB-dependent receptor n=1 Tax=Dyella tabacisoli TaxID=2282381 RepID=A0A369UM34_9GAMM|nr:TonB-dependent receptor [Dyella tabacisoli]RDD81567.1 TonB-dependent receptor [Dyella tabacisoli]